MNQRKKGIVCILAAAFCFAMMSTFVRLSGDIPSVQKSFFRNVVAVMFALVLLLKNPSAVSTGKGSVGYLILRSVFGTIGILCNFYAVDHLVLADATMLNKMSPFFAILFSMLILKERLRPAQLLGVAAAFVGSLFIIRPTFSNMELLPSALGFLGGMAAGLAYTLVRAMSGRGVAGVLIVFFFSAFSCLITLPYVLVVHAPMTGMQLLYLALAGASAAGGQFAITAAYSFAPAREISVYDYAQVLFSAVLGFFLFNQIPDGWSVVGYLLICGAAVAMYFYNNRRHPVV